MLLDLPPSLSPSIPSSSFDFTEDDGHSSRQHLAFVDDEGEEGERQNILFEMEKKADEENGEKEGIRPKSKRISGKLFPKIFAFHQAAIILFTPLILSPLLVSSESEYRCAFCVILMAVYWMGQVMPLAITALLPAVLFPLTGILPARDVSKEFLNDTNFLFLGGLIVATAVEKCQLHERIALRVLILVGSEPRRIMLGFMGLTALLSMFISNTATTAMMLPIGKSVVNLLENGQKKHKIDCILLYSQRNNSEGAKCCKKENDAGMAKGLIICIAFAANIGGVGTLTGTPPNLVLIGMLSTLFPSVDTKVNYLSWLTLTLPLMIGCLLLCWLILCWFFLWNVPKSDQQVGQMIRKMNRELGPMSFAEKSVSLCFLMLLLLWIFRDPGFMTGIGAFFQRDFYSDSTSALLIGILLFLLPAKNPFANRKKDDDKEQKRLMDWPTMQQHFPWNVVILLGGGFALAAGVKKSGLSHLIGQSLGQMEQQPVWILQLICIFATMFVTNICSNTVTASIFIPIVASMAQRTGSHPLVLMLPTTLACSFAFMLPVGSPPNAIVFSSGLLTVSDMIFSGLAISAVSTIAMIGYLGSISPLILPIDNFPEWAVININETNGV